MALKINSSVGKVLYASLFILVLPLLLILWAAKMESNLSLPVYENPILGIIVFIGGMLMMSFGIIELILRGKGLPMNPYPPDRYVTSGIYKFIPHPIYTGASLLIIGISIFMESASGLWIISPLFIIGWVALVTGFEKKDLLKRFPDKQFKTLISIPKSYGEQPTVWNKISAYVLVLVPWLILYQAFLLLGIPIKSKVSYFYTDTDYSQNKKGLTRFHGYRFDSNDSRFLFYVVIHIFNTTKSIITFNRLGSIL
jgi:protein-S-isoprenylcysteine O-methyltransferase Ste14